MIGNNINKTNPSLLIMSSKDPEQSTLLTFCKILFKMSVRCEMLARKGLRKTSILICHQVLKVSLKQYCIEYSYFLT